MTVHKKDMGVEVECGCGHAPANDFKWTKLRERIYGVLYESEKPLGAYDIIGSLEARGRKTPAISVYRILENLEDAGLIHRLASQNAYFACSAGHHHGALAILLCRSCGSVDEVEAAELPDMLKIASQDKKFAYEGQYVEVKGLCKECTRGGL